MIAHFKDNSNLTRYKSHYNYTSSWIKTVKEPLCHINRFRCRVWSGTNVYSAVHGNDNNGVIQRYDIVHHLEQIGKQKALF
jgi:hypothetical protein